MNITVTYSNRTYGTGVSSEEYLLKLTHKRRFRATDSDPFPSPKDQIEMKFRFDEPLEGYSDNIYRTSEAEVTSADMSLTFEEAERLSKALIFFIENAKITKELQSIEFKSESS